MHTEDRYPAATAASLAAMRAESAARRHVISLLQDDVQTARRAFSSAEATLNHARYGTGPGRDNIPATRQALAALDAEVEAARAEKKRRAEIAEAKSKELAPADVALGRCESYLNQEGILGKPLRPHTGNVKPKRLSGESTLASVQRVRADIVRLKAERVSVLDRPLPAKEATAAVRRQIEALAASNAPDVTPLFKGEPLALPVTDLKQSPRGARIAFDVPDTQAMFAWLFRDAIIAKLEAAIEAAADDKNALSTTQKASELTRLTAEILAAERVEQALIESAAADGQVIDRRGDADPRAILWLSDDMPERI